MALSGDLPEYVGDCNCVPCRKRRSQQNINTQKKEEARTWKCGGCGYQVRLTYNDLVNCGTPMCGDCDYELELQD